MSIVDPFDSGHASTPSPQTSTAVTADRLKQVFSQQEEFMQLLKEHRGFPAWPVDISSKEGQQVLRDASLAGIEEWFEALKHCKNWKKHRATDVPEIDRDEFLEEMCDALHYFIEVTLLAGVSSEELFDAYMKKGRVNITRLTNGY
jgi:hypothetical protein